MTRTMYDGITAGNLPPTAQLVAGYIDGLYKWSAANWARFPNSVKVQIAVFASTNAGQVLDVENGDATPAQAPTWVTRRRAAGVDPTVYCSLAAWPAVRAAFTNQGIPQPHYWIAAYPGGGPVVYAGCSAHQYADPGPYDLSVVDNYWPGVDPKPNPVVLLAIKVKAVFTPKPPAPPIEQITQENEMVILRSAGQHYLSDGMTKRVISTVAAEEAYLAAGVKVLQLPDAEIAAIKTVAPGA